MRAREQGRYVIVTLVVKEADGQYESYCPELGTASCGHTIEQALENIEDACVVHLSALEQLGERQRFLKERGLRIQRRKPMEKRQVSRAPDELATAWGVPV